MILKINNILVDIATNVLICSLFWFHNHRAACALLHLAPTKLLLHLVVKKALIKGHCGRNHTSPLRNHTSPKEGQRTGQLMTGLPDKDSF